MKKWRGCPSQPMIDIDPPKLDVACQRKPGHKGKHREIIRGGDDGKRWKVKVTWR